MDFDKLSDAATLFNIGWMLSEFVLSDKDRAAEFEEWIKSNPKISSEQNEGDTITGDIEIAREKFFDAGQNAQNLISRLNGVLAIREFLLREEGDYNPVDAYEFPPPGMN